MLHEFREDGKFFSYTKEDVEVWKTFSRLLTRIQGNQIISFEGLKVFLQEYFGADLPQEIIDQLFLSFSKPPLKGE